MNSSGQTLRRRANAQNVSFQNSLRWPIYIVNSVDKIKLAHQEAFSKANHLFVSALCLAYFDNKRPNTLILDASQGMLGGAFLHPNDSRDLHPVAYTSCKLCPNKELWAQIEKECLAIVSCDQHVSSATSEFVSLK